MNPMQLLNAIGQEKTPFKGLLYVAVWIDEKPVKAMVDSGSTNNFLAQRETNKLGLTVTNSSCWLKVVNSEAKPVVGSARAMMEMGIWRDECNFTVGPLDDFDLILGMEFIVQTKAVVIP